jgi:tellurite resistance protein
MGTQCACSSIRTDEFCIHYLADHDQRVLQALVTAGALVALADGRVDASERDELIEFVDRRGFVPTISRHHIAEAFDNRVRQLKNRDAGKVIVEALRPLAGLSLASVVLRAAERVAAADRQIHPGELRALKLIRLIMMTLPSTGSPPNHRIL